MNNILWTLQYFGGGVQAGGTSGSATPGMSQSVASWTFTSVAGTYCSNSSNSYLTFSSEISP